MAYAIAHIDDIPELETPGECPMRPVRHHFGITTFGINAWTAKNAGDRVINEHEEKDPDSAEELYLVTRGHATFEVDGERHDAPEGTFVFVPPHVKRTAFAEEAGTTVLSIGAASGKPYEAIGWELWHPLSKLYEAGDHAAVVTGLREAVAANPGYGLLFYNLACCESLVGEKQEALEHLRTAVGLSERLKEYARGDSDLDAIRDEPGFRELIAE